MKDKGLGFVLFVGLIVFYVDCVGEWLLVGMGMIVDIVEG